MTLLGAGHLCCSYRPLTDLPEYDVRKLNGTGRMRILYRTLLLLCNNLPVPDSSQEMRGKPARRYRKQKTSDDTGKQLQLQDVQPIEVSGASSNFQSASEQRVESDDDNIPATSTDEKAKESDDRMSDSEEETPTN